MSYVISLKIWKNEAKDIQERLAEKYYNGEKSRVIVKLIKTSDEFFEAWDEIGICNNYTASVDYVVINTHGAPKRIEGDKEQDYFVINTDTLEFKLKNKNKNMKGMLLLGCNTGVVEYASNNVASVFLKYINGAPLLACDGYVVYSKDSGKAWESLNPHFNEDITPDGVSRDPYGWVLYYWKYNNPYYKLLNQDTILINKLDEYFARIEE